MNEKAVAARRGAKLHTPNRLGEKAARDIAGALNALLADFFALYLKTKNFHPRRRNTRTLTERLMHSESSSPRNDIRERRMSPRQQHRLRGNLDESGSDRELGLATPIE